MRLALNFGLTETGFIKPSYGEILDDIEDDLRSKFGDDIVLTSNSNFGIIARLFAWREHSMIEQLEQDYYSGFLSTATGTALDHLGANVGIPRKIASQSWADITVQTQDEYLIQAGEKFETADGIVFTLIKDILTEKQKDGTYSGTGTLLSDEKGAENNVPAGAINLISNPDENVISVNNQEPAGGGQDYEDDETYRNRLIMENASRPGPTFSGVKSALLALNGVKDVNIVQNPAEKPDKDGNPPESVHIYVLGGDGHQIAKTLAERVAIGIRLTGSQHFETDEGDSQNGYPFDFATEVPIYVDISIQTNSDWNLDDGPDEVKEAIANAINQSKMGQVIYLTKLYSAIYSIDGIENCTITKLSRDQNSTNPTVQDIHLNSNEATKCDESDIQLTINGKAVGDDND